MISVMSWVNHIKMIWWFNLACSVCCFLVVFFFLNYYHILMHVRAGGLTENDFILAAKIDKLDVLDLLRRKPSD